MTKLQTNKRVYGCLLKWCYPTTMGVPTKHDHFGVFWEYHHLRKHRYVNMCIHIFAYSTWMDPHQKRLHGDLGYIKIESFQIEANEFRFSFCFVICTDWFTLTRTGCDSWIEVSSGGTISFELVHYKIIQGKWTSKYLKIETNIVSLSYTVLYLERLSVKISCLMWFKMEKLEV